MATKAELRATYLADGWKIESPADWRRVSREGAPGPVIYDVGIFTPAPNGVYRTAQVYVTDDGGAGESAEARGALVVAEATFDAELRTYLDTLEGNSSIFAISVTQSFSTDKVAEVKAYLEDSSTATYVVKQRADTFSFKALT